MFRSGYGSGQNGMEAKSGALSLSIIGWSCSRAGARREINMSLNPIQLVMESLTRRNIEYGRKIDKLEADNERREATARVADLMANMLDKYKGCTHVCPARQTVRTYQGRRATDRAALEGAAPTSDAATPERCAKCGTLMSYHAGDPHMGFECPEMPL